MTLKSGSRRKHSSGIPLHYKSPCRTSIPSFEHETTSSGFRACAQDEGFLDRRGTNEPQSTDGVFIGFCNFGSAIPRGAEQGVS